MARVVVVGGGITGLAAAWELRDEGADVVVLEAGDRLGGLISTSPFAGRPVDDAADSLLARVPWGVELGRELGVGDQLVSPASRTAYVWHDGALRPFPPGHVLGVPTDPAAAVASGVLTDAERRRVEQDLLGEGPLLEEDRSVGAVVRERLGDAVADRLVGPLVGGINAGSIDRLSIDAVTPQLAAAARADHSLIRALQPLASKPGVEGEPVFFAHPQGMGHLVDVLVERLEHHRVQMATGRAVEAIEPRGDDTSWLVHTAAEPLEADQVVLAVPAATAAALLRPLVPAAAELLADIDHASVALVTLAVATADVGRPLDATGYLIPPSAGTTVTAVSWSSTKWAHLAPDDGRAVLRASVGRSDDPSPLDLDDERLLDVVLADLRTTMALDGDPSEVRIGRYPCSLPQYAPGHLDRVAHLEALVGSGAPGVRLAGAAHRGLGIPACIHQGREAAAQTRSAPADRMER